MVIYSKEEKIVIIPEGEGTSSYTPTPKPSCEQAISDAYTSGWTGGYNQGLEDCPDCDCTSAITESYQSGYTAGREEIENNAITLSVTKNGVYSADTGNNIYFKDVEVNLNRNTYRYEVTIYYDSPNGGPNMATHMPEIAINGNDLEAVWYAGLIWGTNIYKTTYLCDLLYVEPQISAITSFDIQLKIQLGTAPDALRCVRVNGADFAITSQTREYLRTDELNFSYWVFHLTGTLPSIPPYDYFDLTSVEVKMSGVNSLNDGFTLEIPLLNTTTTYEYTNLSGGTLDYAKNFSIAKFGNIINMVNNQFIAADLANRGIRLYVSNEDFALWDNDWSVTELRLNGFANNGNYQGGISIPITNVDAFESGDHIVITINEN